jgi:centromeric protein E
MNVSVRVRPTTAVSEFDDVVACVDAQNCTVVKEAGFAAATAMSFTFNRVFTPSSSTDEVYDSVLRPIVLNVLKGVPGCIFAYGQTGSGKTHTVTGTAASPGLLRFAVQEMLERTARDSDVVTSCVYLTYLEVYNEIIRDLLNPSGAPLQLLEDAQGRPHLPNMTRVPVASADDAADIVSKGEQLRAKGANSAHEHASRSHAIFTITVETRRVDESDVRVGLLHVVDLAGSETAVAPNSTASRDCREAIETRKALGDIGNSHLAAREMQKSSTRNREGCHIRRSLLALVCCVTRLADKASFVPFRDSKLTRLLRPPLEGNSNTAVICTVNPTEAKESISTLRFAATAQRIHRTPATTSVMSTDGSMLRSYERQVSMLKAEMSRTFDNERARAENAKAIADSATLELQRANAERRALQDKIAALNNVLLTSDLTKRMAPPTPRAVAKEIAARRDGHRRCGSAPNKRGAIMTLAGSDAAGVAIPHWLRDGTEAAHKAETAALLARIAALEGDHAGAAQRLVEMEESLARSEGARAAADAQLRDALAVLRGMESDRSAAAKYFAAVDAEPSKKSFGCTSSSAVRPSKPILRSAEDIRRSIDVNP